MAIQVILYQIDKDRNSTQRPTGTGNPYMVELKDQCSVTDPVLIFNFGTTDYPSGFNYLCIPMFENRCYWVENWEYFRGLWQASCHVDALASWRADIGASYQYVIRSAADFDGSIVDRLYPTKSSQYLETVTKNTPVFNAASFDDGCYIVGIVSGDNTGAGGGVTYYQMSNAEMQQFRATMLGSIDWADIDAEEISAQLSKALLNPFQYVVSCKWYPFVPPLANIVENVKFGWWSFPLVTGIMAGRGWYETDDITVRPLAQHPQQSRGGYLNLSPYTRRTLYCYPWGPVDLDTTMVAQSTALKIKVAVDLITGEGILYVYAVKESADVLMFTRSTTVGVDVALSQISITPNTGDIVGGLAKTAGAAIASFLGGGDVGAIGDAAMSANTSTSTKGTQGGIMTFNQPLRIVSQFFDVADEDNTRRGRPLMQRRQVSTLPGYMICDRPHIECHATANEIAEIETAMASGFFWE